MNIIKKVIYATLLSLSSLSLTNSIAFADGKADAEAACPGCHGVIINGIQAVGSGGRNCAQRTTNEWVATIERMNAKGCGVPAGSIYGIALYLGSDCSGCRTTSTTSSTSTSTSTSTTSTTTTTLYVDPFGYDMGVSVTGSTVYPIPFHSGSYSVSYTGTITNYGPGIGVADIIFKDPLNLGSSSISLSNCVATGRYGCRATLAAGEQATVTASVGSVGLGTDTLFYISLSDVSGDAMFETNSTNNSATLSLASPSTSTTTSTSSTTTSSTTTTTLCNTYVNGTTQYKYSGSGSCHSFANDDVTAAHIVRDQSYCKKHVSHFNNKGNHVHAYPHPACM